MHTTNKLPLRNSMNLKNLNKIKSEIESWNNHHTFFQLIQNMVCILQTKGVNF